MPKLPGYVQEPIALYPVVEELDEARGVIRANLQDLPQVDAEQRITLGRLANFYGQRLGPADGIIYSQDTLLEVQEKDFVQAKPSAINRGLYIPRSDRRFSDPKTEQLVRVTPKDDRQQDGVVFPVQEFHLVARNAKDLVKHVMAKTRKANGGNPDRIEVDGTVGRSAGHAMESKIQGLNVLENQLIENRSRLLIPLYRETYSSWQSHFKAKNLDKKRLQFDEQLHDTIETANINLNLGSTAVKAVHRAATANMHRRGSSSELNHHWQKYIKMVGEYVSARRAKVVISRTQCQEELKHYEPFLAVKAKS